MDKMVTKNYIDEHIEKFKQKKTIWFFIAPSWFQLSVKLSSIAISQIPYGSVVSGDACKADIGWQEIMLKGTNKKRIEISLSLS